MDERTINAMAVEQAMTADERRDFLANFTRLNPAYRGATVADILDILDGADSDLGLVETMYAVHSDIREPGLLGHATRAVAWTYDLHTVGEAWPNVEPIVEAVRKTRVAQ